MALNFNLLDLQSPERLSQQLNPNVAIENQNRLASLAQENQLRRMQVMQAQQEMQRAPELARRKEAEYIAQQQQAQLQAQQRQAALAQATPEQQRMLTLGVPAKDVFMREKPEDALGARRIGLMEKELAWKMGQKPTAQLEPPPKAPPGTRVYQEGGEWKSEIIKGTPQWQMYKSKEAPDRALVQNIVPQFEKNVSDIDKLVNSKGFDKIFGLIAGQTPNITSEAREAANLRAQVIGAMETSGMQLQRSAGGAVGSMTVQEWPKMQSYMNVIQNSNDPQAVKEALVGAQAVYDRMAEVAKEGYMNEWGSGQFGDPNVVARLSKQKPKTTQPTQQPTSSYEADKEARYQAWKANQGR